MCDVHTCMTQTRESVTYHSAASFRRLNHCRQLRPSWWDSSLERKDHKYVHWCENVHRRTAWFMLVHSKACHMMRSLKSFIAWSSTHEDRKSERAALPHPLSLSLIFFLCISLSLSLSLSVSQSLSVHASLRSLSLCLHTPLSCHAVSYDSYELACVRTGWLVIALHVQQNKHKEPRLGSNLGHQGCPNLVT